MIKTFRAKSIQQALQLVREELGPDASVLHTRRLNAGLIGRLVRGTQVEVAATAGAEAREEQPVAAAPVAFDFREQYRQQAGAVGVDVGVDLSARDAQPEVTPPATPDPPTLISPTPPVASAATPTALFDAFTTLIEAEVDETVCRELLDELRDATTAEEQACPLALRQHLRSVIEPQLAVSGPINVDKQRTEPAPRVVALVGPTGVGKTTTLAKLAANFRLKQNLRVGLITVDTYRVAAVEQLRTYADIIDLPMEVVSTPREMREAIQRFADLDLVLMDTAGRSPRDAVKVQELRSVLAEAAPDEVHLVLSTTAGSRSLVTTAEKFAGVGVTSVLLTKLDEATGLGHVLSLARRSRLPISYLTNGQNVPDDIATATTATLVDAILDPEDSQLTGQLTAAEGLR